MKTSKKKKINIKEWLTIARIKLVDFIKEHKYISIGIGVFLLSLSIFFIVRAADADETINNAGSVNINGFSIKTASTDNTKAPNFTNINYTVNYHLGGSECDNSKKLDEVKFELELANASSVVWQGNSEADTVSEDRKTLTSYAYDVDMCTDHSTTFTLVVGNAVGTEEIKLNSIKIKAGSQGPEVSNSDSEVTKVVTPTHTKTIDDATVQLVAGAAPTEDANNRNAYFGLVAGFTADSLEDTYINVGEDIYLSLSETGSTTPQLLPNQDKYGIYSTSVSEKNYFRNSDLQPFDSSAPVVSLQSDSFRPSSGSTTSTVTAPSISLEKFKDESLEDISINEDDIDESSISKNISSNNQLTLVVTPGNGTTVTLTSEVTGDAENGYTLENDILAPKISMNDSIAIGFGAAGYTESTLKIDDDTCSEITVNTSGTTGQLTCGDEIYKFESEAMTSDGNIKYKISDGTGNTNKTFETTLQKRVSRESTFYKLQLDLSNVNFLNLEKSGNTYKIGTYYLTALAPITKGTNETLVLEAFSSTSETAIATASKTIVSGSFKGTNSLTNDLYVNEGGTYTKVEDSSLGYTASMGENVEVRTSFVYGVDADPSLTSVDFIINIDSKMTPTAYDNDSDAETLPDYYLSIKSNSFSKDSSDEDFSSYFDVIIKYCVNDDTCYESIGEEADTITKLKVTLKNEQGTNLKGAKIELDTMYKVDEIGDVLDLTTLTISSTATAEAKDSTETIDTLTAASNRAMLTPYKIRSISLIGQNDDYNSSDISLDVSRNEVYTSKITTFVESPAMKQHSSIFGYSRIQSIPVVVTLPIGINYVYNDNYEVKPTSVVVNQDGTTTVRYEYTNVEPNTWLDEIYYDFNASLNIKNNKTLKIRTVVGQTTNYNNIKYDISGVDTFRTIENEIRITNVKTVSYGQYTYSPDSSQYITSIDKNGAFDFETQLYNNHSESLNATVYTILPNNNGVTKYHGTYTVSNIPTDAVCTTEVASEDKNSDDYVVNISEWSHEACSSSEISAYRMTYTLPAAAQSPTKTRINISTKNNKAGDVASGEDPDVYEFRSVITYTDSTESEGHQNVVESFNKLNVGVTGKRITGTVWEDFNVDGIMDDDELRLDAVKLILHNKSNGSVVGEPVSPNSKGFYEFNGVSTGTYYITAEYNNDKYYSTVNITDYPDPSKISVFTSSSVEIQAEPESTSLGDDPECEDPEDCDSKCEDPEECDSSGSGTIDPDQDETEPIIVTTTVSPDIVVTDSTRHVQNINLGLALKRLFSVKLNKYITRAEVTNALGIVTRKEYGNVKLAKLDVKDMNNINIKVVYTIELQNIKYYPGYITAITETIPDGMSFNPEYEENKGWEKVDDATLMNYSLQNDLIGENEKKYLTVAFDITRKEAGSFVNTASVDKLSILGGVTDDE